MSQSDQIRKLSKSVVSKSELVTAMLRLAVLNNALNDQKTAHELDNLMSYLEAAGDTEGMGLLYHARGSFKDSLKWVDAVSDHIIKQYQHKS